MLDRVRSARVKALSIDHMGQTDEGLGTWAMLADIEAPGQALSEAWKEVAEVRSKR